MNRMNRPYTASSSVEQLHESLKRRGFLSSVDGDRVLLSGGNGKNDVADLRQYLEGQGVPICYSGNQMQILCSTLPVMILAKLSRLPVRYRRPNVPNGFHSWRAFTKRNHGMKWNTLSLDRGIAYLVKAMSEAGILVTGGCDGHGRGEPRVYFASEYAAAWFEVISRTTLKHLKLNYHWEVVEGSSNVSPKLQAVKGEDATWNVRMIQEDVLTIGDRLRQEAAEFRLIRRWVFKNRSMKQEAELKAENFIELCDWMESLATKGRKNDE